MRDMIRPERPLQPLSPLPAHLVVAAVSAALDEDLGIAGDITTDATVAATSRSEAVIAARVGGVVAGIALAEAAFRELDSECEFSVEIADGNAVAPGQPIVHVAGYSRAILSAERVA